MFPTIEFDFQGMVAYDSPALEEGRDSVFEIFPPIIMGRQGPECFRFRIAVL